MSNLSLLFSNLDITFNQLTNKTLNSKLEPELEKHDINECPDYQCELCSILICPYHFRYHLHPTGCKLCLYTEKLSS